jgi:glyoxylase-like metal-dependent hydrolase (beta-lactamase superfamily II)
MNTITRKSQITTASPITTMHPIATMNGIRPGPDELVPSRYALRLGEIDVLVISDGVVTPPAESMATNADPAVRAAWLDDMFLSHDAFDWALNEVVVRSGGQTILIDSGLGVEVPDFKRAGHLVHRLEAAGIDLSSVTDVVLTHMHFDHVGGLLIDEVRFWGAPDFSRTAMGPVLEDVARRASKQFLDEYRSQLRPFEVEHAVAPGVVVSRTGGHTPGHSVVRLASGGDRLTFAGDAVFAVGFEHPEWYNGFEHDPEEAARVRVRLMRELAETGALLVATHMPFPSVGRVAVAGDRFRWVPAWWDY